MLTGLPNRLAFQTELKRRVEYASSAGLSIALLFVDLDRFKDVNDTLGHEAGDALLQRVAGTFTAAMRHDDFVARLGGDEFAVIVEIPPDEARGVTSNVAERLRIELQMDIPAIHGNIQVGATIGIALYPQDAVDAEGLLHAADQVMYVGKRRGRNRVVTTDELKGKSFRAGFSALTLSTGRRAENQVALTSSEQTPPAGTCGSAAPSRRAAHRWPHAGKPPTRLDNLAPTGPSWAQHPRGTPSPVGATSHSHGRPA